MRTELLISAGPGEWRAIWLEDGAAVELHVERGETHPAGSIHLGRVVRRVRGLDAALVEIGESRLGFLPLSPGAAAGLRLDEGGRVLVEIRREAQGGKGALLSTRLSAEDPARLAAAAAGADPPVQLAPAPGLAAALALRLPGNPDSVKVDDLAALPELRRTFSRSEVAYLAAGIWALDIDTLIEAALTADIALPGGGTLHIEEGHAAVWIDVDTGSPETGSAAASALAANMAAATAVARELRLRQLAGGVIVDFAALDGRRTRERVRQAIAAALAADPARPQILGWTRLGHLELVRPRRTRPLSAAMLEPQSARKRPLALALEALRAVQREARANPAATWRLAASSDVAAALREPAASALQWLESRLGRAITVTVEPRPEARDFDIRPM